AMRTKLKLNVRIGYSCPHSANGACASPLDDANLGASVWGRSVEEFNKPGRGGETLRKIRARDGRAEPDRHSCRKSCSDAPAAARDEPGNLGKRPRPDLSAGAEIRRRRQPGQRLAAVGHGGDLGGADLVLLRRSAARR